MEHILSQGLGGEHGHACPIELRESSDDCCLRIQMKNAEEGIVPGLEFDHQLAAQEGTPFLQTDSNGTGPERSTIPLVTAEVLDLREILPIQSHGDHTRGVLGAWNDRELLLPTSTIAIFQAQKSDDE